MSIAAKFDRILWRIPCEIPPHAQTRLVQTADANLRIRDSGGSRQALVFLCDPPVTVEAYDELIDAFQPEFRVLVVELPCFGFSSVSSTAALSFDGAVRAVEAAISSLELDLVVLFGPCICGFIVAEIAARGTLPVGGVVLMQTPDKAGMVSWVERMDPKGLLRIPLLGQCVVRFSARRISALWLRYATAKSFDARRLIDTVDNTLAQGGGYPLATMLQLWSKGTKNAGLNIPALVIWGKQDRSHADTDPQCTQKHAPDAKMMEFPDCGHFTELEKPRQFADSVVPFVRHCLGRGDAEQIA
jgi:pimeloyl-ACP methyl ester carboxylesterase